jgi:hypothetical protein
MYGVCLEKTDEKEEFFKRESLALNAKKCFLQVFSAKKAVDPYRAALI